MIDFELTDEQKLLKETIHDFAAEQIRPISRDCDENEEIAGDIVKTFQEFGLIRTILPTEYGGDGEEKKILDSTIIYEELAWGDLSIAMHLLSPALFAYPVLEMGTAKQKEEYLPLFTKGDFKPATMAVMEPSMFFDLASLSTVATLDGDEYSLNGKKCYVPLGSAADLFLIFAATNSDKGYDGVDGFIVKKDTAGLTRGEREKNMGLKALETVEMELDKCRVPATARLGGEDGSNFLTLMNYSRIGLTSMAVGMARAAYEYARDYAKERMAFGEPIASRQAIAFMLAEMAVEIDATRLLLWEASWKMDRKEEATREAYLAKRYAADMVMKTTDRAVQVLGGHGYIREHPVELWMRNARGFSTFEGMVML